MIRGIYRILNLRTGAYYFGSSSNIERRFNQHKWLLNKRIHFNYKLQSDWLKFGEKNFRFSIIQSLPNCNREELCFKEQEFLDINPFPTYNISKIAKNPTPIVGYKHNIEIRKKLSSLAKLRIGNLNPFFGKNHSNETKEKIRQKRLGMKHSEETKKKISEISKRPNPNCRKFPIKQIDRNTNEVLNIFLYTMEASKITKIDAGSIGKCINHKLNNRGNAVLTAGNFKWEWSSLEEYKNFHNL